MHVPRFGGDFTIYPAPRMLDLFRPGDCIVVNNTRVIQARLLGNLPSGGAWEIFLVQPREMSDSHCLWEAMVRPGKRLRTSMQLELAGVKFTVQSVLQRGMRLVHFPLGTEHFYEWLERAGHVPLPPYIRRPDTESDRSDYQTVFSREPGAVAAPTASLHFSTQMVDELPVRGVELVTLTLHVGPGTFQNIEQEDYRKHAMHSERYFLSPESAERINQCRARGGRIIAVGTTCARVLETLVDEKGVVSPGAGETDIFLYPGHHWRAVDGLLTNFHWPRSSLILLVSSFLGRERTLDAYKHAVNQRLMLFSYGDGMLIM